MQQTSFTNDDVSVKQAENAVTDSIAKFETAMEHLADKVENTTERVHHIIEVAQKPVQDLRNLKERVEATATPLFQEVRANPRPWIMTLVFLGASYLFFSYMQNKQRLNQGF